MSSPFPPLTLALESSCDETAVAFVAADGRIFANAIASQMEIHAPYGGVVPELASRAHVERGLGLLEEARREAGDPPWEAVEGIAATRGPGLAGCLLVGLEAAKGLALARGLPFVGVNHLAGHLWSVFLRDREGQPLAAFHQGGQPAPAAAFTPPYLGLIVSGGHSSLALVRDFDSMETLGETLDDAAGEAYDKVAKLLGLGYPGGPVIDRLARAWEDAASPAARKSLAAEWPLPRPLEGQDSLDFSFSGLKSAVARLIENRGGAAAITGDAERLGALLAAFQRRVVETLLDRARRALLRHGLHRLAVVGGVACNGGLRRALAAGEAGRDVLVAIPPPVLCTDNAAMIGAVGARRLRAGARDPLDLNPATSLPLERARRGESGGS